MRSLSFPLLPLLSSPLLVIPLLLGASSIGTLLLYFYGFAEMGKSVRLLLLPATVLVGFVLIWAKRTERAELYDRVLAGLWAGTLATFAYDIVRLPIARSGVPVFKAISYFGTIILGQTVPTLTSDVIGWLYHLSNGVGFGLMYAVAVPLPQWWTAIAWGLFLEGAMLVTPYAEVFGYKLTSTFIAISLGAHVVYGAVLCLALRSWLSGQSFGFSPKKSLFYLACSFVLAPLGIGVVAADFHQLHVRTIPPSPPGYLGPHLYTTWDALEPDRLAALWILRSFVDKDAHFHFVAPFSHIARGTPFDTPEAETRRSGSQSATEVLLANHSLAQDERLAPLGRMAHLYEITPWMLPRDPQMQRLGQELMAAAGSCPAGDIMPCVERAFTYLDQRYQQASVIPSK
jgi:hypothetical protein